MNRTVVVAIKILLLATIFFTNLTFQALAVPILDQSNIGGPPISAFVVSFEQNLAQRFTVGISGILSTFAVDIGDAGTGGSHLVWSIRRAILTGALAAGVLTHSEVPTFPSGPLGSPATLVQVDVSSFAIPVFAGEQLFLYLDTADSDIRGGCFPYCWSINSNGYPRGEAFEIVNGGPGPGINTVVDHLFQTFVDPFPSPAGSVPEPSTLGLAAVGLASSVAAALRRRHQRNTQE